MMPPFDAVVHKIQQRGHWRVVVRPTEFDPNRVPDVATLFDIVQRASVELRGWDVPHIDVHEQPRVGPDFVEHAFDWSGYIELWRLYQSGQFYFLSAMSDDWGEEHGPTRGHPRAAGPRLPVTSTVIAYTEWFELAARLVLSAAGGPRTSVSIEGRKLGGRVLWNDNPARVGFSSNRICQWDGFGRTNEFDRDELVADAKGFAVREVGELFKRFTWSPGEDFLADMQAELYRRP